MREAGKAFAEGTVNRTAITPASRSVSNRYSRRNGSFNRSQVSTNRVDTSQMPPRAPSAPRMVRYGLSARSRCATAPALREISRSAPWAACAQNRSSNAWSMPVPPSAAPAAHSTNHRRFSAASTASNVARCSGDTSSSNRSQNSDVEPRRTSVTLCSAAMARTSAAPASTSWRAAKRSNPLVCPCWVVPRQINASSASGSGPSSRLRITSPMRPPPEPAATPCVCGIWTKVSQLTARKYRSSQLRVRKNRPGSRVGLTKPYLWSHVVWYSPTITG